MKSSCVERVREVVAHAPAYKLYLELDSEYWVDQFAADLRALISLAEAAKAFTDMEGSYADEYPPMEAAVAAVFLVPQVKP